jgi:N-acetylglucosamine-6-phosphate deacetylase
MNRSKPLWLKGGQLYLENTMINDGFVQIDKGIIANVGSLANVKETGDAEEINLPPNFKILPGMIDLHIHGVAGADTMDGSIVALETMAKALPEEGTTSFLATTITQDIPLIEKAVTNVRDYLTSSLTPGKAEVLGVHLEGPFINEQMAGAQPIEHIALPNLTLFKKWQALSKQAIKLVTLAPEMDGCLEFISYLTATNVVSSVGHSNATYKQMQEAIVEGASQITHLFNQMSPLHHREPGVVGAAFLHDELKAELIADGIHVMPEVIKIIFKQKGANGIILISDAMRAKGLENGTYDLGGQSVKVQKGKATLQDGTLAGSILKLNEAVLNILSYTNCTLADVVKMTAVNPAKQINVFDRKGSIKKGKDADLIILDEENQLYMTICRGKLAYKRGG